MAASQNPVQGSLFEGCTNSDIDVVEKINAAKTSNDNLSNQQLKEDASLRPRTRKNTKNPNPINELDQFSNAYSLI